MKQMLVQGHDPKGNLALKNSISLEVFIIDLQNSSQKKRVKPQGLVGGSLEIFNLA